MLILKIKFKKNYFDVFISKTYFKSPPLSQSKT